MSDEVVTLQNVPVSVDPKTAEDRGDNFVPNDDVLPVDNNGDSIDPNPAIDPATLQAVVAEGEKGAAAAPAPAAADEAEEVARQNGGLIPKSRFNEVNEARKREQSRADLLAEEVARLKAAPAATAPAPAAAPAPAEPEFDVNAQERAYAEAMQEGDTDKALTIRQGINDHLLATAEQRATSRVRGEMAREHEATALQEASTEAIAAYPFLDTPDGAVALTVIVATRDHYIAQGMKQHLALKKAVAEVAPKFAPAAAPATPSRDLPAAAPAPDTRSAEALRRGAADSQLQPPAIVAGIGNRATQGRIDVNNLTEDQFAALPDAEKKRLRGD